MADANLDVLLRTTDNTIISLEQSKKFTYTKRKINSICKALSLKTQNYGATKNSRKYRIIYFIKQQVRQNPLFGDK